MIQGPGVWSWVVGAWLTSAAALPGPPSEIQEWLWHAREQAAIPGLAVIVVRRGGETSFATLGVDGEGRDLTPQSVFGLGSVSMTFTGLGVMRLVERGALRLEQPAADFVPGLDPRITIRHLLYETSGLPPAAGFWLEGGGLAARVEALPGFKLRGAPGAGFVHSNANYDALGWIIERASGKPYPRFMREEVLAPAGLRQVWLRAELPIPPVGYQDWFGVHRAPRRTDEWSDATTPAAGYFATPEGLGAVLRMYLEDGRGLESALLSPAGFQAMRAPLGTPVRGAAPAMGWSVRELDGRRMYLHSASGASFSAGVALFPEAGLAVAALANVNGFQSPATRLAVREIATGVAQLSFGGKPGTSAVFGYRNQSATKWLFSVLALGGLAIWVRFWQVRPRRPRVYIAFDLALAAALLHGIPWVSGVPLPAMFQFQPDVAVLLVVGGLGALTCAAARVFLAPTPRGRSAGHGAQGSAARHRASE